MIEQTLLDGRVELYSCCIFQLSILNNKYHKFINSQRNEFKHTKLIFTFQLYSNYHDLTILLCQKFLHSFFQFSHKLYMEKYYIFLFFSFFLLTYQLSLFLHVPLTLVSSPPLYFLLPHPASLHPYPAIPMYEPHQNQWRDHFHPRVLFHPFPGLHHPLVAHSTVERIHLRSRAVTFLRLTQPFCSSAA